MKWLPRIAATLAVFLISNGAWAGVLLQFSAFGWNMPASTNVTGIRFPIFYGKAGGDLVGFDVGVLAYSELHSMKGIQTSILPMSARVTNEMAGIAVTMFNWHEGRDTGLNLGVVNLVHDVRGANLGFVNVSTGHVAMDLVGFVNVADSSNLQVGFVNVSGHLRGLQLGFISCAKNAPIRCFPILNLGWGKRGGLR